MMFARLLLAFVLLVLASTDTLASRGGSNYHFYRLDGCYRESYGVLKNYHTARAEIDAQLASMRAGGQDRLRLGIYHARDAAGGTVIASNGGNMDAQYRQNLADLLATVKQLGYAEILFSFFPQSLNNPVNWGTSAVWTNWHEEMFQENWNLIYNVIPILEASGIHYVLDLGNELSPPAGGYNSWNTYAKRMWGNYVYVFGNTKTVGFSLPGAPSRADNLRNLYGNNPPHLFELHVYDDPLGSLIAFDKKMDGLGYKVQGWVIGEAYYNDENAARQIAAAISASYRTGHYLIQWPLTSAKTCADVDVIPLAFDSYMRNGF